MEEPKQILTPEEVSRLAVMAEAELANEYLYQILEVGQTMLQCGGEVSRVEESIRRMCLAFGAERADVFTITSSIVVTVYAHKFGTLTQTRRISGTQFDLHRLELLNALSRRICAEHLGPEETARALEEVQAVPQYGPVAQMGIYALASASFSLFFGGSFADVVVSGCIAVVLKIMDLFIKRIEAGGGASVLLCSCLGGLLSALSVRLGLGDNVDMISIGNIMLLIPGVALTNSLRDMFGGTTLSGIMRFIEALLQALTIAFGFALAARLM